VTNIKQFIRPTLLINITLMIWQGQSMLTLANATSISSDILPLWLIPSPWEGKHHIFTGAGTGTPIVAYTMLEIPKKHERPI